MAVNGKGGEYFPISSGTYYLLLSAVELLPSAVELLLNAVVLLQLNTLVCYWTHIIQQVKCCGGLIRRNSATEEKTKLREKDNLSYHSP